MPVVVTGAGGLVGRAVLSVIAPRGVEVRGVVRDRAVAEPLRATGAKVAVCELSDTDTMATVMSGAHTVCHLAGGLHFPDARGYEQANLETTRAALRSATEAGVTRFLFLSYPGASADSANPYLRAKGRAEEEVRSSGLQHVILRSTHIYGPGSRWLEQMREAARRPIAAAVVGPGTQRLAPVFVEDVALTLAAADDRDAQVAGTFALQGPDEVTADELVDLLAGRRRRKIHLSPTIAQRLTGVSRRPVSEALLEILAADSLADAPGASAEFGVAGTPLREGLRRS